MLEISREDVRSDIIVEYPIEDRFIKVPIENYLRILPGYKPDGEVGLDPIGPQIALINALNDPKYRFVVAALSRRTGKTEISNIIAQLVSFMPGSNVLIIAPNYGLSQISWDLQRKFLGIFEIELERSNAKDKVIELKNGSTIRMASVSQADSAVGRSYDFILFDEAALEDKGEEAFNIRLMPTLDKANAKVVFISTPRGRNWFHTFYMRGWDEDFPEWVSIHSDYLENPRVPDRVIEESRKAMSRAEFMQEYHADFVSLQGQIYNFDRKQIVEVRPEKIDVFDTIAGLDVGFRDATAFVVILTDGENFFVVEEYESSGKTTAGHAQKIKKLVDKWDIDFIYIDAAAQQTKFDFAMNFDISTNNAKKSVLDGIGYVASIVDHNRLFVDPKCKHTIAMLENYVWDNREGLIQEKPKHDKYSHMGDALRYALYSHAYNVEPL